MTYNILMSSEAWGECCDHFREVRKIGTAASGARFRAALDGLNIGKLSDEDLFEALLNTKEPQFFAESQLYGDGTDWTQVELKLLGDVVVAVPVLMYDDGRHDAPTLHEKPFSGTLLYVPGALLRNDRGREPCDLSRVVRFDHIDEQGLLEVYRRRLLPAFIHASETAGRSSRKAIITVPGIGCGQFAGRFRGKVAEPLRNVIYRLVEECIGLLPHVRMIYFDPYSQLVSHSRSLGHVEVRTRPYCSAERPKSQLSHPRAFEEDGDDFSDCDLFSVVAWDHVSWPGNDFYEGDRSTDDGVKAAATSSMTEITGAPGRYDVYSAMYLPLSPDRTWREVVEKWRLRLSLRDGLMIYSTE